MIEGGIGNPFLQGVGVEIGIADLNGNNGGKFLLLTQLKGQLLHHGGKQIVQSCHIHGILLEGPFTAEGFSLGVLDHGSCVDAIGLFPDHDAIFSQQAVHHLYGNLAQGAYGGNSHGAQLVESPVPDHRDLPDRKGREKILYLKAWDLDLPVGFSLSGGNL